MSWDRVWAVHVLLFWLCFWNSFQWCALQYLAEFCSRKKRLGKTFICSCQQLFWCLSSASQMTSFSSNQTVLISSLFLDKKKKKTKIKSCSRCFVAKGWDSKSSQLYSFHFLCWKKNKKSLHNWDSKQSTSKPCSLFNTERRKYEFPTTTKHVCFHTASLLGAVDKRLW